MKRIPAMSPQLRFRPHLAIWALAAATFACNQVDDLREWRADDHTQADGVAPVRSGEPAAAAPAPQPNIDDEVIDVWRLRCARCHGPGGLGNGPEGPMYKAPSLARPDWQATVTDAELRKVISEGRGRMPATQLTPKMLDGMVRLVRSVGRGRSTAGMPPGAMPPGHPPVGGDPRPVAPAAAAPSTSAQPPPSAAPAARPASSAK